MDINFELYKIFYHAAKCTSFTDAAQKLYISQSAVSQSIKNLEELLQTKLFYRKSRTVTLTREGELLFKHIQQAYNFIKTAESKVSEMQNLTHGEIRLGVSDTICKYYLIPYIKNFTQTYPNIKIQVINRTSSQIINTLKNGIIDVGIVTLPIHDSNIIVEDFKSVEDIFVASSRFSALENSGISLKDLSGYPLLMLPRNSATRQNIDSFLKQKGVNITPEIELESIDLLVEFARIGLGIAHVLKESALAAINNKELFIVNTTEIFPKRTLGISVMKDVPLSRASSEFIRFLKD